MLISEVSICNKVRYKITSRIVHNFDVLISEHNPTQQPLESVRLFFSTMAKALPRVSSGSSSLLVDDMSVSV